MILAMSKKGYGETMRILTQTYLRKSAVAQLQLAVESPIDGSGTDLLRGSIGWLAFCNNRNPPLFQASKKSDGGHKLRATCSERIRAKRQYPPPTPSALYRGNPLKIIVKTTGDNHDH